MSDCGCSKNQTSVKSLEVLADAASKGELSPSRVVTGTGLFVIPDPEVGILETKVVLKDGLTYKDCCLRGQNCLAFKWVADSIMSFADIEKARAERRPCPPSFCRAPIDCPEHCTCDLYRHECSW